MVNETLRAQFLSRGISLVEPGPGRDFFFKEMFWAPEAEVETCAWVADAETLEARAASLPPAPGMRPLAGPASLLASASRDRNRDHELQWRFDLVNAPYADDHRIDGTPVLPFACAVEMMAELPKALGAHGKVASIEDIRLFRGLTLENGPMALRFELDVQDDATAIARILSDDSARRPFYQARLTLADSYPPAGPVLVAGARQTWRGSAMTEIYRRWLSHGPRFQTLKTVVGLDSTGLTAIAQATRSEQFAPVGAIGEWTFDPGLVDGVLHSFTIWARARHDMTTLPLSIKTLRRFCGDPTAGPLRIETDILSISDEGGICADFRIWDAQGRLCYLGEEYQGQAAATLNRLCGRWSGGVRDYPSPARLDVAE
jgi:hypothetical protein